MDIGHYLSKDLDIHESYDPKERCYSIILNGKLNNESSAFWARLNAMEVVDVNYILSEGGIYSVIKELAKRARQLPNKHFDIKKVRMDFQGLEYLDTTGVAIAIEVLKQSKRKKFDLEVLVDQNVLKVFETERLSGIFKQYFVCVG